MRLFFALAPSAEMCDRIAALARALPTLEQPAREVPHANYHLTVAFAGEVADAKVDRLKDAAALLRAEPFTLRLDAYEYWRDAQAIVTVGQPAPAPLIALHRQLRQTLRANQLPVDSQRLRPHITLVRRVVRAPSVLPALPALLWPVHEFCLMRSDTGGAQSVYSAIARWPLVAVP